MKEKWRYEKKVIKKEENDGDKRKNGKERTTEGKTNEKKKTCPKKINKIGERIEKRQY